MTIPAIQCPLSGIQLIEASAGTGKTWTLSALYARLIVQKQLETKQILAITFTNAAAAELRDRIRRRLVEIKHYLAQDSNTAQLSPDPVSKYLKEWLEKNQQLPQGIQRLDSAIVNFDAVVRIGNQIVRWINGYLTAVESNLAGVVNGDGTGIGAIADDDITIAARLNRFIES